MSPLSPRLVRDQNSTARQIPLFCEMRPEPHGGCCWNDAQPVYSTTSLGRTDGVHAERLLECVGKGGKRDPDKWEGLDGESGATRGAGRGPGRQHHPRRGQRRGDPQARRPRHPHHRPRRPPAFARIQRFSCSLPSRRRIAHRGPASRLHQPGGFPRPHCPLRQNPPHRRLDPRRHLGTIKAGILPSCPIASSSMPPATTIPPSSSASTATWPSPIRLPSSSPASAATPPIPPAAKSTATTTAIPPASSTTPLPRWSSASCRRLRRRSRTAPWKPPCMKPPLTASPACRTWPTAPEDPSQPANFREFQKFAREGSLTVRIYESMPLRNWKTLADLGIVAPFGNRHPAPRQPQRIRRRRARL